MDTLRELGYRVQLTGCEEPRGGARKVPTVLYLAHGTYCCEQLERLLASGFLFAPLAVLAGSPSPGDVGVLSHCGDFLTWPCGKEELMLRLRRLGGVGSSLEVADRALVDEFSRLDLIGDSPAFLEVLRQIKRLAGSDAPVLIRGETGTGKELAARAIHYLGDRRSLPFIPVNCGAIPDSLVENELFGHDRGAFTDANAAKAGLVAEATGGTLFLDEIDALSSRAQIALLRFLQDQEYRPLGASRARKADVRIIAATNADLCALALRGAFRQDLLFRLRILLLTVPSLGARSSDIPLLAEHFLDRYSRRYDRTRKLSRGALEWMSTTPWPGNVRELENAVHRTVLMTDSPTIEWWQIAQAVEAVEQTREVAFDGSFSKAKARVIASFEKQYLTWLMSETGGNVTLAARRAKKERRALGKLLKKHGVAKPVSADRA